MIYSIILSGISGSVLPGAAFTLQEVQAIQDMILATRLPARPKTPAEQGLVEADLSILGSDEFYRRSIDLRNQLAASGHNNSDT